MKSLMQFFCALALATTALAAHAGTSNGGIEYEVPDQRDPVEVQLTAFTMNDYGYYTFTDGNGRDRLTIYPNQGSDTGYHMKTASGQSYSNWARIKLNETDANTLLKNLVGGVKGRGCATVISVDRNNGTILKVKITGCDPLALAPFAVDDNA